ncbi:MAG: cell division protein FtsA [Thermodesulfobacteriota bacterium]|nr:cell division protein FtsA [Thermodesulfobacteriota bacterium]
MSGKSNGNIIAGLDIGTTKISTLIGRVDGDGIDILGVGNYPSYGMKSGMVINMDNTVSSIRRSIKNAEDVVGCEINSVLIGIAGGHIVSINNKGFAEIKDKEVTRADIRRAINSACDVTIPKDHEILSIITQEYLIDDQTSIQNPIGICGSKLEVNVHIIIGATTQVQNLIKCTNQSKLYVEDIILQPLASSLSVLTKDEMELGVTLVDIGGGTTDLALFFENNLKHTSIIPIGGNQITKDIAFGLKSPIDEAEKIKIKYGCTPDFSVLQNEEVEVPDVSGTGKLTYPRQYIYEIIGPRVEEILLEIKKRIQNSGYLELMTAGVVITGGSALLGGLDRFASEILGLPVRIAYPRNVKNGQNLINHPKYSTGVGLILNSLNRNKGEKPFRKGKNPLDKITQSLKRWFEDIF